MEYFSSLIKICCLLRFEDHVVVDNHALDRLSVRLHVQVEFDDDPID